MNFGNALSLRVEELMDELRPAEPKDDPDAMAEWVWTEEDEKEIYDEALAQALEESNGIAWAAGNIRIGELILIIDSDTRVPEDCFLDAASYVSLSCPLRLQGSTQSPVLTKAGNSSTRPISPLFSTNPPSCKSSVISLRTVLLRLRPVSTLPFPSVRPMAKSLLSSDTTRSCVGKPYRMPRSAIPQMAR